MLGRPSMGTERCCANDDNVMILLIFVLGVTVIWFLSIKASTPSSTQLIYPR
jgi:hypothetical protein